MKVYHGSYTEIKHIDLLRCEPYRDFGRGFYVTKIKEQAELWAKRKGRYKGNGFVTEFEFYYSELVARNCKIKQFETYSEEWLDFVILNRNDKIPAPAHDYDIVEGPVADDKIQNRIVYYLDGQIGKAEFLEELKWHEETHQICFCTVASLVFLKYIDPKRVLAMSHLGEPIVEKLVIDFDFDEQTAGDKFFSSGVFSKLTDTETELCKADWKEVYRLLLDELGL
jgi:hypothetical protein